MDAFVYNLWKEKFLIKFWTRSDFVNTHKCTSQDDGRGQRGINIKGEVNPAKSCICLAKALKLSIQAFYNNREEIEEIEERKRIKTQNYSHSQKEGAFRCRCSPTIIKRMRCEAIVGFDWTGPTNGPLNASLWSAPTRMLL